MTSVAITPRSASGRRYALVLLVPPLLFLTIFLVFPLIALLLTSLQAASGRPGDTAIVGNYLRFLTDSYYLGVLLQTFRIAIESSLVAVLVGYPMAVFLSLHRGWLPRAVVIVILSPLFVSVAVRAYAWTVVFAPTGPLGRLELLFKEPAVVVGLVHFLLPFIVLSLTASLSGIDPTLVPAARSLGSGPVHTFRTVLLPLSVPGLIAGVVIAFSMAMTSFAIPLLLGGSATKVVVRLIYEQELTVFNRPFAAAMSVTLLVVTLLSVLLANRVGRRWEGTVT